MAGNICQKIALRGFLKETPSGKLRALVKASSSGFAEFVKLPAKETLTPVAHNQVFSSGNMDNK